MAKFWICLFPFSLFLCLSFCLVVHNLLVQVPCQILDLLLQHFKHLFQLLVLLVQVLAQLHVFQLCPSCFRITNLCSNKKMHKIPSKCVKSPVKLFFFCLELSIVLVKSCLKCLSSLIFVDLKLCTKHKEYIYVQFKLHRPWCWWSLQTVSPMSLATHWWAMFIKLELKWGK